jgi:hypothetical protein
MAHLNQCELCVFSTGALCSFASIQKETKTCSKENWSIRETNLMGCNEHFNKQIHLNMNFVSLDYQFCCSHCFLRIISLVV